MQILILEKLSNAGTSLDTVLSNVVDIAVSGRAVNPVTGELEESDKIKLEANKLLLEMMGALKGKGGVNINNNLFKLDGIINGGSR